MRPKNRYLPVIGSAILILRKTKSSIKWWYNLFHSYLLSISNHCNQEKICCTHLYPQRCPNYVSVGPERDLCGPRSWTFAGVGSDLELVLSVVIQIGEDGLALSRCPCQLVLRDETFPQMDIVHGYLQNSYKAIEETQVSHKKKFIHISLNYNF